MFLTSIMIHAIPTVYIQKVKWQQSAKQTTHAEKSDMNLCETLIIQQKQKQPKTVYSIFN